MQYAVIMMIACSSVASGALAMESKVETKRASAAAAKAQTTVRGECWCKGGLCKEHAAQRKAVDISEIKAGRWHVESHFDLKSESESLKDLRTKKSGLAYFLAQDAEKLQPYFSPEMYSCSVERMWELEHGSGLAGLYVTYYVPFSPEVVQGFKNIVISIVKWNYSQEQVLELVEEYDAETLEEMYKLAKTLKVRQLDFLEPILEERRKAAKVEQEALDAAIKSMKVISTKIQAARQRSYRVQSREVEFLKQVVALRNVLNKIPDFTIEELQQKITAKSAGAAIPKAESKKA